MIKIEPSILKGTRDFMPWDMLKRNFVINEIKCIFENFGYMPIETPIISPAETILGKYGEEGDRLTYSFKDRGDRLIALPYDLTVPFARFVASNYRDLAIPFKRYQIQRVWRAEKPQKGRLREFYQCDIDIIGTKSLICEAEIVKIICLVFEKLKIKNIKIKINSRKIMNDVLKSFGIFDQKAIQTIRIIDKIEKIGKVKAIDELKEIGIKSGDLLIELLTPEDSNEKTLKKLSKYSSNEFSDLLNYSEMIGVEEKKIQIDGTLARGLDYYTGFIFEVVSEESNFGTICAGGRYDNLCGLFSDKEFSGVGVAFGFERIMLLLDELKLIDDFPSTSIFLVTIFDENSIKDAILTYKKLIENNIPAEIYLETDKLSKQIKFADKKRIPYVLIRGPEEISQNLITIKNLKTQEQKTIKFELDVIFKSYCDYGVTEVVSDN